jgi:KDO2-lipid IV(A) lauroyltransferase
MPRASSSPTQRRRRSPWRALSRLPLGLVQAVGAMLGWLLWRLPNRERRISEANLARCYPGHSEAWRARTLRRGLIETGKTATESVWLWSGAGPRGLARVRETHGEEALLASLRDERGIIVATPHFGNWELAGANTAQYTPLSVMFRPPRHERLTPLLRAGREHLGMTPVAATTSGVRAIHRTLLAGGAVGLLPDQRPRAGDGVYAPFFGHPALTMTLIARLARRANAVVVMTAMERLPRARGFRAHFWRADDAVAAADSQTAAAALNREVERCVAIDPAQYTWSYKRFRGAKRDRGTAQGE